MTLYFPYLECVKIEKQEVACLCIHQDRSKAKVLYFRLIIFDCSFKNNTSFVSRFNTLRRGRSSLHHSKLPAATNASSDNLNSGHPTAAGISASSGNNPDETQQQPLHCALSREASLKKGSDGKI